MNRAALKVISVGAISLGIALQPAIAAAAPDEIPLTATARSETTAPFDPICPLCFLRELIESGSSRS